MGIQKRERNVNPFGLIIGSIALAIGVLGPSPAYARRVQVGPTVLGDDREVINVGVGQSRVIDAPWSVAKVSITDPTIADVQVLSQNQVLLLGNDVGATDLVLWNADDEVWSARVNVLIDLTHFRAELRRIFPDSTLEVQQSQDVLVITGQLRRTEDAQHLHDVMEQYDIKYLDRTGVAGVQQVQLKVRVAEVSRRSIRAMTVNFVYNNERLPFLNLVGPDTGGGLLSSENFLGGVVEFASSVTLVSGFTHSDLLLFIQALTENQYARVLAEPSLVALSGEEASFLAGGEFPIPVVQGTTGGTGGTSISIEYKEFGVQLRFRPTVLGDGSIRLEVAPEVSELSDFGAVEIEGFRIPSILTRRAETTLELKDGQTFIMAGLLNQSVTARRSAIPLLGDLPVVGALFRSVRYVNGETELAVLVTVNLVEPLSTVAERTLPGDLHKRPSDWEVYANGQIEGTQPSPLAPADAQWLQSMGLSKLMGPGAWTNYEYRPVPSAAPMRPAGRVNSGTTDSPGE